MNLCKSVDRYTTEIFTDPYGVGGSIKGKLSIFEDEKSSGVATRRRILETLPTYIMYSTNCVLHNEIVYIVGTPSFDYYKDYIVRAKYVAIPCDSFYVGTVKEILSVTYSEMPVYLFIDLSRLAVADSETTDAVNILTAYLPSLQDINKGDIVFNGFDFYKVRSHSVIDGAGFKNVELVQLENPVRIMNFVQKAGYDVATDSIVNSTSVNDKTVFVEDAYYCYDRTSVRYNKLEPGDKNITVDLGIIPKAGDTIGEYKILSAELTSGGAYSCHCRI